MKGEGRGGVVQGEGVIRRRGEKRLLESDGGVVPGGLSLGGGL